MRGQEGPSMASLRMTLLRSLTVLVLAPVFPAGTTKARPPGRFDLFGDPLPPGALFRLGTTRLRHMASGVAWLPDRKTLVSAQAEICLWDADTGKLLCTVPILPPGNPPAAGRDWASALA